MLLVSGALLILAGILGSTLMIMTVASLGMGALGVLGALDTYGLLFPFVFCVCTTIAGVAILGKGLSDYAKNRKVV